MNDPKKNSRADGMPELRGTERAKWPDLRRGLGGPGPPHMSERDLCLRLTFFSLLKL